MAAKHLVRYLKGTKDWWCIQYSSGAEFTAYSDASYISDPKTGRSRTGYIISFADGPISWNTKLQPTIALSSAEAEYMALTDCSKELTYLTSLAQDLGEQFTLPVPLYADNQPSIKVAKGSSTRMRHINVRYHYIRQCLEIGLVELHYISTQNQVADIMTKSLDKTKVELFRSKILRLKGSVDMTSHDVSAK